LDKMTRMRQVLPLRRGNPDDYTTNCPGPTHANGDKNPSLHVSRGRNQDVVLRCFSGCTTDEVLAAAGLTWADLCEDRAPTSVGPSSIARTRPGFRGFYR